MSEIQYSDNSQNMGNVNPNINFESNSNLKETKNSREVEIHNWLNKLFAQNSYQLVNLAGDASTRKYYRLFVNHQTFILMDSKKDPSLEKFIAIQANLRNLGVSVPNIVERELNERLLLLNDLGDDLYLSKLNEDINSSSPLCNELYTNALKALVKMQKGYLFASNITENNRENFFEGYGCNKNDFSAFNFDIKLNYFSEKYLINQLNIFQEWYLEKHKKITLSSKDKKFIKDIAIWFAQEFQKIPQTFVHLDYHSRNLLVIDKNSPGIIDFQDAMFGPSVYDLASLFQDAYIHWPESKIKAWLNEYNTFVIDTPLHFSNLDDLYKSFDLVGISRHLKNLGVFARLYHRDGKAQYLKDIPLLLHYIKTISDKYPELFRLKVFLKEKALFKDEEFLNRNFTLNALTVNPK